MVYDMAGYHSKEKSTSGHLDRKRSREDTSGSDSDEPNESYAPNFVRMCRRTKFIYLHYTRPSTDGRTTPRSWNASEEVTPELTPEGSRTYGHARLVACSIIDLCELVFIRFPFSRAPHWKAPIPCCL